MRKFHLLTFLLLSIGLTAHSQTLDTLIIGSNYGLHFSLLQGKGIPILFEAGNGDDASVWTPLLQDIHEATGATLITYDRAGLGQSSIDTSSISFEKEVQHLQEALEQMGYGKEFFLVAHSFGSYYASEFAQKNKGKIRGAVFIDIATPCGLHADYVNRVVNSISQENWKLIKEYKKGLYYVLRNFPEITEYMSDRFLPADIPVTVIAAELRTPTKEIGETEQDMVNTTDCIKAYGQLPKHKYVLAPNTEHKVWKKNPELVVKEITELYRQTAVSKQ